LEYIFNTLLTSGFLKIWIEQTGKGECRKPWHRWKENPRINLKEIENFEKLD
jgi:hypothetical protein